MAVRKQLFFIAVCDVTGCGAECDEAGDRPHWGTTRIESLELAADAPGWTEVEGGIVCGISDQAHDEARGGDSTLMLRPSNDAMHVTFEAPK